jgi:hypothetical protein
MRYVYSVGLTGGRINAAHSHQMTEKMGRYDTGEFTEGDIV